MKLDKGGLAGKASSMGALLALALAACAVGGLDAEAPGEVQVYIHTTATQIPPDGECAHITATRLSDFQVSEFRGMLAGAVFKARQGEHRVVATAYPQPCDQEPATSPWVADEQIVTFGGGTATLVLNFKANVKVQVVPEFDNERGPLVVDASSRVRTGRNGEDMAGPSYSLDGWEVKQIALPPPGGGGTASETVLFSMQGQGGIPYSPRGLAHLADGRFVAQVGETFQPLFVFDASGAFQESWPVIYPAGTIQWDFTDGLELAGPNRFVRTGWLFAPIGCDAFGAGCIQSAIEILEVQSAGGLTHVEVVQQILLPELPGLPLNREFAVGVAYVGGNYAVTTLPAGFSRLILLAPDGTLVAGPTAIPGPSGAEGLFDSGDGRLGVLEYDGRLTMYNPADVTLRAGEELSYPIGVGFSNPFSLTWSDAAGAFIALAGTRLVYATPGFDAITDIPLDLSGYVTPSGMDTLPGANQLAIADRLPPIDPATNLRIPTVDFYDLSNLASPPSTVTLQGISLPARTRTIALMPAHNQIASHYRRPGNPVDPTIDAVVYINNLDGTPATSFDLAAYGFTRIGSVSYLAATDELLFIVVDTSGVVRALVTDPAGNPRRSYRTDAIPGLTDLAPITSGAFAGQVGAIISQPSEFMRVSLP